MCRKSVLPLDLHHTRHLYLKVGTTHRIVTLINCQVITTSLDTAVLKKRVEKCKVVFDYVAEASDELSLKIGDIIEIVRKDVADGWWEGKLGGKVGVFPDNFVEIIAAEEEVRY